MRRLLSLVVAPLFLAACAGQSGDAQDSGGADGGKADDPNDDAYGTVCAAVRGNGPAITAHFGSLSRFMEHYGPVDKIAGGSSGSITSFLVGSMSANPLVETCGGEDCTQDEKAVRVALMLKSLQGYLPVLADSEVGLDLRILIELSQQFQEEGIESLLNGEDALEGVAALESLLSRPEYRDLLNEEVLDLLANSPDPVFHAQDIVASVDAAINFQADDPTILVRPGLIDFGAFAELVGRVGSFYAGYGPFERERFDTWLEDCAEPGRGMNWDEVATLPTSYDSTCGEEFGAMLSDYREAYDPEVHDNIVDTYVGDQIPAMISTSVFQDDAVVAWNAAREAYQNAEPVEFDVSFDDVRFGYWGTDTDLLAAQTLTGRDDLKSQLFTSLGEATWREVLGYSPAEPGLARALELPDGRVSAGGWSDLNPTLVLESIGCQTTVLVTRQGPAHGGFAEGVARLLGVDDARADALFSTTDSSSSVQQSIAAADAVWCTDWDGVDFTNIPEIAGDAWAAPMYTTSSDMLEGDNVYPGAQTPGEHVVGCTQP